MPMRVLLVEDDLDIAAGIGDYLSAHGIDVDFAGNAVEARARVLDGDYDVFVLDVNLPGEDGVSLCRALKQDWNLRQPTLFLTAHGALDDKLRGFAAGALDYVVKPFAPAELLARLRAIAGQAVIAGGPQLRVGDYVLDLQRSLLSRGAGHLQLHATGAAIVKRLMQAHPGSVSKRSLSESVWGDAAPESDPLRAHIYQLRQAMQAQFGESPIDTVRGVGYRFGSAP